MFWFFVAINLVNEWIKIHGMIIFCINLFDLPCFFLCFLVVNINNPFASYCLDFDCWLFSFYFCHFLEVSGFVVMMYALYHLTCKFLRFFGDGEFLDENPTLNMKESYFDGLDNYIFFWFEKMASW